MTEVRPVHHSALNELCEMAGLVPGNVLRLDCYPDRIEAHVCLLNDKGKKYYALGTSSDPNDGDDVENAGELAKEIVTIPVHYGGQA